MEKKNKYPVIEEDVTYDDRRKELTHSTKETRDSEYGSLVLNSKAVLHEAGIRKTVKNLEQTKKNLEDNVKVLNERQAPTPKMTPELQKLKDQLIILEKIRHDERITEEDKKKEEGDLLKNSVELKKVTKDLRKIKEVIGTRLKF